MDSDWIVSYYLVETSESSNTDHFANLPIIFQNIGESEAHSIDICYFVNFSCNSQERH